MYITDTEEDTKLKIPILGEEDKELLPIPVSPAESRRKMIEEVAEELHPGNWEFNVPEPKLQDRYNRNIAYTPCACVQCIEGHLDECANNNGRPLIKRLIIRFPEVTIRNEDGDTHLMKDFYVAIAFDSEYSKALTTSLYSMRSTVTTQEYAAGVFHPHSSTSDKNSSLREYFKWRVMCLGGDTELTDIMYSLVHDGVTRKDVFELLVMLHVYAGWESADGGPYRCMKDFKYPTERASSSDSLPIPYVISKLFPILYSNNEIQRPEIVGSDHNLSINNVSTSLAPATKLALLAVMEEEPAYLPVILSNLGTESDSGFVPLSNTNSGRRPKKPKSFYFGKIQHLSTFNARYADQVLKFKGSTTFVMTLDDVGFGDSEENITEEMIASSVASNEVVREVAWTYIKKYKEYKSTCKI